MKQKFHELLLSELHMVVYQPGSVELTDRMLCEAVTLNENLRSLGFTLRPRDMALLAASPELYSFFDKVHALVPQIKAKPMYPGFPQQVLDMDEATFRMHQAMHYFSTYGLETLFGVRVSRGWLPEDSSPKRTKEAAPILSAKVIELVAEAEAPQKVLRILLGRRERLTNPELELVTEAIDSCSADDMIGLKVRFKENLELLFPRLMALEDTDRAACGLHAVCAHSGDILRCAHSFIKERGYHLKTAEKKRIVRALEMYRVSDLKTNLMYSQRLRERNVLVLQYLDYNRFSDSAEHREAVRALRNDELLSWNGMAEQMLSRHDPKALSFLAGRPGTMLRMLNRLLSLDYSPEAILSVLKPHAAAFSGQMLMKVIRTLSDRKDKLESLHTQEIQECMHRYAQEMQNSPAMRYERKRQDILWDVERRRSTLRNACINTPRREASNRFKALKRSLQNSVQQTEDELEDLWDQLELLDYMQAEESVKQAEKNIFLIRNATQDWLYLLAAYCSEPSELVKKEALLREQWDRQSEQLDALQKQMETELEEIEADGQAKIAASLREIDAEKQRRLAKAKAELDAELEALKDDKNSPAYRQARELEMLEERHQSRVRISQFDAAAVEILKKLCLEHFRQVTTPLHGKKVFLKLSEFDLSHSELETTDRSKDGGYIRSGIAFRIPEQAKTVRFFTYWNDRERVDIDLHAAGKTLDGRDLHIGWNASCKDSGVVHSGDITHSDAAEYIDIDLSAPVKTITANVNLYCGRPDFKHIETCYVGLMAVSQLGADVKHYSPANCFFTHRLTQTTRNLFYGYIDVEKRFVRFIGKPNMNGWAEQYTEDTTFSLQEYLDMVLEGQEVRLTESEEEADVVLTMGKGLEENSVSLVDENFFLEC